MTLQPLYAGPVIDAHHHFWDPTKNPHPWLTEEGVVPFRYGDYRSIRRPYLPDDYFADAVGQNVVATIYMETEWDPSDSIGETRYADGLAARHGVPDAIVAQAWLDRADVAEVLAGQAAFARVRSVRHKPGGPARPDEVGRCRSLMSDDAWRRGYALLEPHDLMFDLQTPWWNFDEAIRLARDFPSTTIVLNHAGLPSDRSEEGLRGWAAAMAKLAACPNVMVKISGIGLPGVPWTAANNRRVVRETIAHFGADRAMFASNFPVDRLCGSFSAIFDGFREIVRDLPEADRRALFCDNALRIYRLDPRVLDRAGS